MGVLKYTPDLSNIKNVEDLVRFVSQSINQLQDTLGGAVEFDSNILSQSLTIVFPTANVAKSISHKLNKTGVRFIVVDKNVSCDVFHTASLDDVSHITLTCTQAATVKVILI